MSTFISISILFILLQPETVLLHSSLQYILPIGTFSRKQSKKRQTKIDILKLILYYILKAIVTKHIKFFLLVQKRNKPFFSHIKLRVYKWSKVGKSLFLFSTIFYFSSVSSFGVYYRPLYEYYKRTVRLELVYYHLFCTCINSLIRFNP